MRWAPVVDRHDTQREPAAASISAGRQHLDRQFADEHLSAVTLKPPASRVASRRDDGVQRATPEVQGRVVVRRPSAGQALGSE